MFTSFKGVVCSAFLFALSVTTGNAVAQQPAISYSPPATPSPIYTQPVYVESTATKLNPHATSPFVGLGESLPVKSISVEQQCRNDLARFRTFPFEFSVQTINGHRLTKESFEGQVLVAVMWASWCGPCRLEIPHLVELQNRYGARGMSILGMANEGGSDVQQMITTVQNVRFTDGINYLLALGSDQINQQIPNFGGFPTMLILDQRGNVRMTMTGYQPIEKLEAFVRLILNENAMAAVDQLPSDPITKLSNANN